jgi:subfamily B ATP-binding cassette protein MsbA
MLCLVWFGGSMILDKQAGSQLTGEVFITFVIVFSQLLRPIQGIATSIASLNKAKASQDRINEVLNADEKIQEVENPLRIGAFHRSIRFENVTFSYADKNVLTDINLEVKKGQTLALVGESGSGKSTMADLIPRFYDVVEGSILIDGIPITQCGLLELRNLIGIVSQEPILFNASVRENIAFGRGDVPMEEVIHAAKIAHAHAFIEQLENGYETVIGERGSKLSGGQRQRISIARAVLKNPAILILDEATSALDTESEKLVQDALEKLMAGRTTIVIAHRLSTITHSDEIVVLSAGKMVERGKHKDLLALGGIYHSLCSLQGIHE